MGAAELAAAVVFFITVSGTLWGIWWKIDAQVKAGRQEAMQRADAAYALAALAQKDIADLRLHAAESYATKDGMQRQTDSLLRAIESVAARIDGLNDRLDNILLQQRPTPRART